MSRHAYRTVIIAFLVAIVPFAWLTYRFNWLVDDAFISFRYARHLAQGHGLRYNLDEHPPVEGYSNFLWVLLLAPFEFCSRSAAVASRAISVVCGVAIVWRAIRFMKIRLDLPLIPLILGGLFLATLPPLTVWSTSGLETVPFALVVFLAFEFLVADPSRVRVLAGGITLVVLVLLRIDGMVWAGIVIGLAWVVAASRQSKSSARSVFHCAAIAGAAVVTMTVFRLLYFGWPLPNTVYAKVGLTPLALERGILYVLSLALTFPHIAIVAVTALFSRGSLAVSAGRQGSLVVVCGCCYAASAGGDWMAMGRHLIPVLPFAAIAFATQINGLWKRLPAAAIAVSAVALILSLLPGFNIHVVPRTVRQAFAFLPTPFSSHLTEYETWKVERDNSVKRIQLGRALRRHTKPGESLIALGIGAVGYYSDLKIYDPAGLVNVEVAHRDAPRRRVAAGHDKAVDRPFFFKYKPTYCEAFIISIGADFPSVEPGRRLQFTWQQPFRFNASEAVMTSYSPTAYLLDQPDNLGQRQLLILFARNDLVDVGQMPLRPSNTRPARP